MRNRIGPIDIAFGIIIGIVSWAAITSGDYAGWPKEFAALMAVPPAVLFAALFSVCFYIVRASVMFEDDVRREAVSDKWWDTFKHGE